MSSLVKTLLNGIINTASTKLEGKETKMFKLTTKVPEIDKENENLFRAAELLESLGNNPGCTANDFYSLLSGSIYPDHEHESLALAAIAIEMMMSLPDQLSQERLDEPTVH